MPEPQEMGYKWCPRCKRNCRVTEFPVDRWRRDGRWHSCKICARNYWGYRGVLLRAGRKEQQRLARGNRSGLEGLRKFYSHQKPQGAADSVFGWRFASVPANFKHEAQRIFSAGLAKDEKDGVPFSRQRNALRIANAASNASKVGSRSFAARMNAFKRWKRHRQRLAEAARANENTYPVPYR